MSEDKGRDMGEKRRNRRGIDKEENAMKLRKMRIWRNIYMRCGEKGKVG